MQPVADAPHQVQPQTRAALLRAVAALEHMGKLVCGNAFARVANGDGVFADLHVNAAITRMFDGIAQQIADGDLHQAGRLRQCGRSGVVAHDLQRALGDLCGVIFQGAFHQCHQIGRAALIHPAAFFPRQQQRRLDEGKHLGAGPADALQCPLRGGALRIGAEYVQRAHHHSQRRTQLVTGRRRERAFPFHELLQALLILVKRRGDLPDLGACIVRGDAQTRLSGLDLREAPGQVLHRRQDGLRGAEPHGNRHDQYQQQAIEQHAQHRVFLVLPFGDVVGQVGGTPLPLRHLHLIDEVARRHTVVGARGQRGDLGGNARGGIPGVKLPARKQRVFVIGAGIQLRRQHPHLLGHHVAEDARFQLRLDQQHAAGEQQTGDTDDQHQGHEDSEFQRRSGHHAGSCKATSR